MAIKKYTNGSWASTSYRKYGTETDAITTLPATVIGDGTPISSYTIKGNMEQSGTPTPSSPIYPSECGEKTVNVMPSAPAETKTNNGITVTCDGNGVYTLSGTALSGTYIIFRFKDFTIPISVGQGGQGTMSLFNTVPSDQIGMAFLNGGTSIDAWTINSANRKSDSYIAMGGAVCNAIQFYIPSGSNCDCVIKPCFTNDSIYPANYEPYGYKLPMVSRGENLFDVNANNPDNGYAYGKQVTLDGSVDTFPQANVSEYISITPFSSYTFTYGSQYNDVYAALYNAKREFVRSIRYNGKKEITFYSQEDENYLRFTYLRSKGDTVMLNSGPTALPYESYRRTVTNIYLGEAETTRRIKKLVLDGTEDWTRTSNERCYYINSAKGCPNNYLKSNVITVICSHYAGQRNTGSGSNDVNEGCVCFFTGGENELYIGERTITSAIDFKAYLAQQYTNGTPVTMWYVLKDPTTGIVNEPIRKIGDYVDSVSGTNLATSGTAQEFDVDTTLKPSEVDLTYHGWHEHDDTKYST